MSLKDLAEMAGNGGANVKDWIFICAILYALAMFRFEMLPGLDNIKKTLEALTHGFIKIETDVENIKQKQNEHGEKLSRLERIPIDVENLKRVVYKAN